MKKQLSFVIWCAEGVIKKEQIPKLKNRSSRIWIWFCEMDRSENEFVLDSSYTYTYSTYATSFWFFRIWNECVKIFFFTTGVFLWSVSEERPNDLYLSGATILRNSKAANLDICKARFPCFFVLANCVSPLWAVNLGVRPRKTVIVAVLIDSKASSERRVSRSLCDEVPSLEGVVAEGKELFDSAHPFWWLRTPRQ